MKIRSKRLRLAAAAVLLIDPEGRFSALFSGPHEVANYVHDLPILMGES